MGKRFCTVTSALRQICINFAENHNTQDKHEKKHSHYEKMEEDPNYFFKETAFLKLFLSFLNDKKEDEEQLEEI